MVKNILVVDDDTDLLYCYEMMLHSDEINVYTSDDVDEAQEIVMNHQIHLAILDFMLPKLTGDKLAKRIHEIDENVKIIFVSGYAEVVEAVKKLDITIHGVFMKPVNPEIVEKIAEIDDYDDFVHHTVEIPAINMYSNI